MKVIKFLIVAVIIAACNGKAKPESNESSSITNVTETNSENLTNEFTAESFTDIWWNSPTEAIEKYSDKGVMLTGVLARDGQTDNVYLQGSNDSKLFIACEAASGNDFSSYKKDEIVKIKGVCKGMSMSVNLKQCVVVN